MSDAYRSAQKLFLSGEFGNSYIERNDSVDSVDIITSNLSLLNEIFLGVDKFENKK